MEALQLTLKLKDQQIELLNKQLKQAIKGVKLLGNKRVSQQTELEEEQEEAEEAKQKLMEEIREKSEYYKSNVVDGMLLRCYYTFKFHEIVQNIGRYEDNDKNVLFKLESDLMQGVEIKTSHVPIYMLTSNVLKDMKGLRGWAKIQSNNYKKKR